MTKRCLKCNKAFADKYCYCPYCGKKLNSYYGPVKNISEEIAISDWVGFLKFRMEEIAQDSRTIYSAFWQKIMLLVTFVLAILSIILAVGTGLGIESMKTLVEALTSKDVLGIIGIIFLLNILLPVIVGFVNQSKQKDCYKDYEKILSKILFEGLNDILNIRNLIKQVEEKQSISLWTYLKKKIKGQIEKELSLLKK